MDILNHFHTFNTKDEQDLFLQSLFDSQRVKQRRPRKEKSSKKKSATFKYHVMVGSDRMLVCFKAFLSLNAVTKKRVERLRALKMIAKSPVDNRGCHIKQVLSEEIKLFIRQHLKAFQLKKAIILESLYAI